MIKDHQAVKIILLLTIVLVTVLASLLTGCSYRLDTNGYCAKCSNK
jgi:hypothetical protein